MFQVELLSDDGAQWIHVCEARLLYTQRTDVGKLNFYYDLLSSV